MFLYIVHSYNSTYLFIRRAFLARESLNPISVNWLSASCKNNMHATLLIKGLKYCLTIEHCPDMI